MGLFWSGATPVFSSVPCPMTRLLKTVTHAQTLLKLQKFPPTGKLLKLQIFPPAGNSGPYGQKNGGGIVVIPPPRFTLPASSSGGLSAWRWACALPRCGSRDFRISQRIPKIRTRPQSETDSDFVGLVRMTGLEPVRPWATSTSS